MTRGLGSAWAVLAALAAAGCATPRTEILLVVGADLAVPGEMDGLRVRATGMDADGGLDRTFDLSDGSASLPIWLALVSAGGRSGPLHVDLVGSKNGAPVVERSATTAFVEGKVLVLHLDLERACAQKPACPAQGETCVHGTCVSEEIPSSSLAPYPEKKTDASDSRARDASTDVFDAAPPRDGADAKSSDAPQADGASLDAPDAGTPALLANGASCDNADTCASRRCVDGVCCETDCNGACRSCSVTPGTCTLLGDGAPDPRGACPDQGASSCGTTGRCDGDGACQRYPAETVCAPERCSGSTYQPASTCATGTCGAPAGQDCQPGTCQPGGCSAPVISFGTTQATALQGYDGPEATNFQDSCPTGSVVTGVNAGSDSGSGATTVAQIATKCGVPSIQAGRVVVTPGTALPLRGSVSSALDALDCPSDQVVIGFDGHALALLDQLSVRCAPLSLSANGISIGTPTDIGPEGGDGGTPFARTDCGPGMVAVGTNVAIRTWASAFGLVCAPILAN
jgi:hypothetical protein